MDRHGFDGDVSAFAESHATGFDHEIFDGERIMKVKRQRKCIPAAEQKRHDAQERKLAQKIVDMNRKPGRKGK